MKKIFCLFALLALFASCEVDDTIRYNHTGNYFLNIFRPIIDATTSPVVGAMIAAEEEGAVINSEDFSTTMRLSDYSNYDCQVSVSYIGENEWKVEDKLEESLSFTMRRASSLPLAGWTISDYRLKYSERSKYRAEIESIGDVSFEWQYSTWGKSYDIFPSGQFSVKTYREGSAAIIDTKILDCYNGEYTIRNKRY